MHSAYLKIHHEITIHHEINRRKDQGGRQGLFIEKGFKNTTIREVAQRAKGELIAHELLLPKQG